MAKNYSAFEAAKIINSGLTKKNAAEYMDITRRFPFFAANCMKLNEAGMELIEMLPDYISARKINKSFKDKLGIDDEKVTDDDIPDEIEEEEEEEEKPAKKAKKDKKKIEKKSKKAEPEEDEDEDDIEELEEEEEEKPKKAKKASKKAKKEKEEEEDDFDDFDLDD